MMQQQSSPEVIEYDPSVPSDSTRSAVSTSGEHHVVGVDIGGTNLRVALADARGAIVGKWSTSTVEVRHPQLVVDMICQGIGVAAKEAGVSQSSIRAIAAGAPGITDVDAGVVIATSYLMGWRNVPLRKMLELAAGVPAAIDNDVNVAALGENFAGAAKDVRDFVFLAIGTGVGAGIVLNGKLFHGSGWIAGEIGYMLVPGTSEEPLKSGEPGALEEILGGEGIKAQWRKVWSRDKTALPADLNATRIFDHALLGEPLAQSLLQRTAQTLSYAIYNMALVLDCPLFVLGGTIGLHPALCDAVRGLLAPREAQVNPEVRPSLLGADAPLVGAVRMALDLVDASR